ncbi:MAG: GrpB family protein [Anaerolineae bacterium]
MAAENEQLFQIEVSKIAPVFGSDMLAIHHLGGMTLPGIMAKPIIEIGVELHDIESLVNIDLLTQEPTDTLALDKFTQRMLSLGYIPRGEQGVAQRRLFTKSSDPQGDFHLHVYPFGCPPPVYQHNFASSPMLMVWMGN